MKVDAAGPVRCTLLVVRDGIDSGATSDVSRLSSVTNPVDPNTRRPRSPRSWPYRLGCVAAQAETAGEQKSRLSTRGALESVTGLVHVIRTASMPSAKSRFRSCEQRCFGPPASAPGTGLVKDPRAARDAPRRSPHCPEQVYCCLYRGYRPH